jgi:hypothetical protein
VRRRRSGRAADEGGAFVSVSSLTRPTPKTPLPTPTNQPTNQQTQHTNHKKGIGKSLADKLASQGLNVVLVALGDAVLDAAHGELRKRHPARQFRKVGCDLSAPGGRYMDAIAKQTRDVDVQLVFCNAGYILPGFFHTRTQEQVRAGGARGRVSTANMPQPRKPARDGRTALSRAASPRSRRPRPRTLFFTPPPPTNKPHLNDNDKKKHRSPPT